MADKKLSNNEQIKFLHGTQANLNKLGIGTAGKGEPGTFYFTTDSRRMYLAQADGTIVPVNDSITSVESIGDLPQYGDANLTIGSFYYSKTDNILCIWNGTSWVQINPDTNTVVDAHTVAITTNKTNAKNVDIATSVEQDSGTDYTASWTLIAGDKIKLTAGTKTVTIDCTAKYTLGTAATESSKGVITLTDNSGKGEITTKAYIGGSNGISVTSNANGVTIDGSTLNNADIEASNLSIDGNGVIASTLATKGGDDITGDTITPIIKLGENATEYKFVSGTATLPVYTKTEVDNKFKGLDAVRYRGTIGSTAALNALQIDTTDNTSSQVAIGDAYKLTASNIQYKDRAGVTQSNTKSGDLLIAYTIEKTASGEPIENANGYINANKVCWDLIPSGDDTQDTTYNGVAVSGTAKSGAHGLSIENNGGQVVAEITAQRGNNWIEITSTPGKTDTSLDYNDKNALTIKHAEFTNAAITAGTDTAITQEAESTQSITYVTSVTRDKAGHITGYNTQTATLIDTNTDGSITTNSVSTAAIATASLPTGATSAAKFTHTTIYTDIDGNTTGGSNGVAMMVASKNENIKVDADATNNAITLGFVWGTF